MDSPFIFLILQRPASWSTLPGTLVPGNPVGLGSCIDRRVDVSRGNRVMRLHTWEMPHSVWAAAAGGVSRCAGHLRDNETEEAGRRKAPRSAEELLVIGQWKCLPEWLLKKCDKQTSPSTVRNPALWGPSPETGSTPQPLGSGVFFGEVLWRKEAASVWSPSRSPISLQPGLGSEMTTLGMSRGPLSCFVRL